MKTAAKRILVITLILLSIFSFSSCKKQNECEIVYFLDGGYNTQNPTSSSEPFDLLPPEKAGFSFLGWYEDETFTTPVSRVEVKGKDKVTLYAKWGAPDVDVLIISPNGALGAAKATPLSAGESVTLPENIFAKNGYKFLGYSDTPSGEATYSPDEVFTASETSPRVLYAIWEKVENADTSLSLAKEINYNELYVQEGLLLLSDFFGVTTERNDTKPLLGSASYDQVSATASKRFTADDSNYTPFIHTEKGISLTGGTAKIVSPWCFENWYLDYTVKMGTGSKNDMRVSLPTENVLSVTSIGSVHTVVYNDETEEVYKNPSSDNTVYATDTMIDGVTDYYISNGKWAKKIYSSKWGDNCLILGQNSTMNISGLYALLKDGLEDYSIQAITSFESSSSSGTVYMVGMARFSVGLVTKGGEKLLSYRGMTKPNGSGGTGKTAFEAFNTEARWYDINENTFTFNRDYSTDTEGTTEYEIYVNGKKYFTHEEATTSADGTIKIGEGQNTKLYAVRIYSHILTEKEISQNHFVDIANFYKLDISKYLYASDEQKEEIHEHFKYASFGSDAKALQAEFDSFFPQAEIEGVFFIEFNANLTDFGVVSEQYAISGASISAPEISLAGSTILGWSNDANSDTVIYKYGEQIKPTQNEKLYAVWQHNEYKISYDTAGCKLASGEEKTSYIANTDIFKLPELEKDGYVFCGWYKDETLSEPVSEITYGTEGDLSLVAGWVEEKDRLFSLNITEDLSDISEKYDADFTDNANVLEKFMLSKAELPEEITVLPRFDVNSYLISNRTQFYVATNGSDENDGSINFPFATIERALFACRGLDGAIIWVRGGDYFLDESVYINSTHSGTAVSPLILSAYKDEKPVLHTAKTLAPSQFSPVSQDDKYASRLPANALSEIVHVNLFELGWTEQDLGKLSTSGTPSLFINNEKMDIARYPNSDETPLNISVVYDTGSVTARDGSNLYSRWILRVQNWEKWKNANGGKYDWDVYYYDMSSKRLYASEGAAIADAMKLDEAVNAGARVYTDSYGNTNIDYGFTIGISDFTPFMWENDGNIWYYGNVFSGWEYGYYNVKEFNLTKKSLTTLGGSVYGANVSSNSPTGHNDYYLYNIPEALDSAGEWYLDYETGDLYIYKTENFDTANITYTPTTTVNAVTVSYAKNVIINGINVDSTSGYGINVGNSENVIVQGCTVKNVGENGISVSGSKYCAIIYNDISSVGKNMIYVGSGSTAKSITPEMNVVQNNICHSPLYMKQGGIGVSGCRNVVSHNTLHDVRINFSSTECIIEYNDINGGSKYESDAGMIYTNGYYSIGNHIRYNYLHNWGTPGNGVYFDDLNMCNYAYYNIMDTSTKEHAKATGFCYTSTGHYNVFYGNIMVGRSVDRINESAIYLNRKASLGYRWEGLSATFVNSYSRNYNQEKLAERFPELLVYLGKMSTHVTERAEEGYARNELEIYLRSPANNIVKNNVVVGTSVMFNQPELKEEDGTVNPSRDYVGENFHSTSYEGFFEDFTNGNFTLLEDALKEIQSEIPDFKPLSTERCGVLKN